RIVVRGLFFLLKIAHVKIHLPDVAVCQLADFQINQHKTFEQIVVKHQVNVKMIAVNRHSLLSPDKREAASEFEQEGLQTINQALLQVFFAQGVRFCDVEEFQHKRVFDEVLRRAHKLAFIGEFKNF